MSISSIAGSAAFTSIGAARLNALPADASRSETRVAFEVFAEKTPAERMREALLARLGLKESDLQGMAPEKRQAIEEKLAEMIKQEVESAADQRPGRLVDLKA